jgi:type I restriction enzyme S subunit
MAVAHILKLLYEQLLISFFIENVRHGFNSFIFVWYVNNNLEEQADALYQSFFSPKSGTQGKVVTLDEYCSIFTGKKNANASVEGGKYKFFTCAPDALQIDSYIYDGNAIIVSGNGAYTGRTRFYSGRFDLYQRTYACTLLDHVNPDYIFPLYWFVKLELSKKIMGGTRGSAIPYIVMNDLAKFEFVYNEETFATYTPVFKSLTESIQSNEFENERLAEMRDALLPQLLSGQLDVSNIDD